MITINTVLVAGILVPALLVPGILYGSSRLRRLLMVIAIGALFFNAFYILTAARLGTTVVFSEVVLAPVSFSEHVYSNITAFGFTLVGSLGLLYGLKLSKPSEQAIALMAVASAVGIVFSDNYFVLFLFWEMLTLSTAGLILLKKSPESLIAGFYFLAFHLTGGLVVLFGILQHYSVSGSFDLVEPQAGLLSFVIGFGFKAAFLPLHMWLARGYPSANFPSSVLLAGLTTKIGVYAIARMLPPLEFVMYMGASMALFGVTCALLQHNMRRLLSYHIISQVGFMVAGVGLATHYAVDGALLHLVNHMLYKALLFMSAGAVLYATQTEDLHDLTHLDPEELEKQKQTIWKALPIVTVGAVVGALAISGFPFFNGYVSKYLLKNAMYGMGLAETMLLIASVGTAASFCKLIFFGYIRGRAVIHNKISVFSHLAIIFTAALCVGLGIYPQFISTLLPYSSSVTGIYSLYGMWSSLRLILIGMAVFAVLSPALKKGIHVPPVVSIEYLIFIPISRILYKTFCKYGTFLDYSVDNLYLKSGESLNQLCHYITTLDKGIDSAYDKTSSIGRSLADRTEKFDKSIDEGYSKTGQMARKMADRSTDVDSAINEAYRKTGEAAKRLADQTSDADRKLDSIYNKAGQKARNEMEKRFSEKKEKAGRFDPTKWTTKNLSFDTLLLFLVLGIVLFVIFYYGRIN